MLHQKDILQWLKMFSVNQIKHFLTIKNPKNLNYVERILNYNPECKTNERWNHGISEQIIQNQTSIYIRDNYRYKKQKDKKKAADECLSENLTVSRTNPYSFSVTKEFIKSGKLSECMLILSDGQIFNCFTCEPANYQNSAWFHTYSISSFSMWIIRLFELEIFQAYYAHENVHSINHLIFAQQCINNQKVKQMLEACISRNIQKSSKPPKSVKGENEGESQKQSIQITKQEGPYLLQKCFERLEQKSRDIGEIIFEDIWSIADGKNKISRVYRQLCNEFMEQYSEYLIDVKCQEIQSYANSKKRKKKAKKPKEQSSETPEIKPQTVVVQALHIEKTIELTNTLKQSKIANQRIAVLQPKKIEKCNKAQEEKQQKHIKQSIKHEQSIQTSRISQKKLNELKQKQQQRKNKKIINQRINENIQIYYQQLYESSQSFDKYRKICYQIIKLTIQQLKIVSEWRLELFGSASIEFALKQSDLDLVLIIPSEKQCSLVEIFEIFKFKQWLRQCNIILQARVPIVEFEIMLSQIKHPKLKEHKKIANSVIHVDISISHKSSPHQGLKNTQFLKQIFENHPSLRTICLILKELLRVNELNKPYKGGIGSYVLVILVHNILRMKQIDFEQDLLHQLKGITKFLTTEFEPFVTLISPFKKSKLQPSSEISLNIEDPDEKVLLHTNARLINEIIFLFKQLHYTLESIQSQLTSTNIHERKKMKKIFFQNWNILFKRAQQQLEA